MESKIKSVLSVLIAMVVAKYGDLREQIDIALAEAWANTDSSLDAPKQGFLAGARRGQGNLTSLFIGIMVAAIMGVAVVIPVVQDIISDANLSGTVATIVELIPLFIGLLLLVSLASPLMRRT